MDLLSEAPIKTDDQGFYSFAYPRPTDGVVNLQIYLEDIESKGKDKASDNPLTTKYNAGRLEELNLTAPAGKSLRRSEDTEYKWLTEALENHLPNDRRLAYVVDPEDNYKNLDRLTLLRQNTGWDARLIFLAATAERCGSEFKNVKDEEKAVLQEALYGLFRLGLPTDMRLLARVRAETIEEALRKASESGIVNIDDEKLGNIKEKIESFSKEKLGKTIAPGTLSSLDDMLGKSGIEDENLRAIFKEVYFAQGEEPNALWRAFEEKLEAKAVGEQERRWAIGTLRLQGKLAYLTHNNADLTKALQERLNNPDDLANLAAIIPNEKGKSRLYQQEGWQDLIKGVAKGKDVQTLIPRAYNKNLDAYAADLARKVRLSFPTRVVRQMLADDEMALGKGRTQKSEADVKKKLGSLLEKAEGLGFEFGHQPAEAFLRAHEKELFSDKDLEQVSNDLVVEDFKRIGRLYQTTPSLNALAKVSKLGFDSASSIARIPNDVWMTKYRAEFDSPIEADLTYRKAQQIDAITTYLLAAAKRVGSNPRVFAIDGTEERRDDDNKRLEKSLKDYPTLSSFFGSMDFCECEHCRSVLSPAAYFVDLLDFLGTKSKGQKAEERTPLEILTGRRPDLQHLPLTCENTHTVLPYIDIVNEILEYFVAHGKLDKEAAYDTGAATTPELLAEPQHVLDDAYKVYKTLREETYPLTLPFDLHLETVRSFFNHLGAPLWRVLEVFSEANEANKEAVCYEYLGLSPSEYETFTKHDQHTKWYELYGYENGARAKQKAVKALKEAKTLSQRLSVSYKELTDLVQTSFVNPALDKLGLLWKLQLGIDDVKQYFDNREKPQYADERTNFENRLELHDSIYEQAEGTTRKELVNLKDSDEFKNALFLSTPLGSCNFDETLLQFVNGSDDGYPLALLKINLFVRLWRKLGWTMEETDRALQAFLPQSVNSSSLQGMADAFKTALKRLAYLKDLDERLNMGPGGRLKLLTFWSDLTTTGKNPLYDQLFPVKGLLKADSVFDDLSGDYLSKSGDFVGGHLLALQGALNLTADEVKLILVGSTERSSEEARQAPESKLLTLATVSQLYRYRLLAKALKLSVRDLIILKGLSGCDPFRLLKAEGAKDESPYETLRFLEEVEKVRASGFSIEDLDYLLRHQDPFGKYRSDPDALLKLVDTLATGIRRIQEEHADPKDPAEFTDDLIRQKLSLVLPPDVAETFFSMLVGTKEYEAEIKIERRIKQLDKVEGEIKQLDKVEGEIKQLLESKEFHLEEPFLRAKLEHSVLKKNGKKEVKVRLIFRGVASDRLINKLQGKVNPALSKREDPAAAQSKEEEAKARSRKTIGEIPLKLLKDVQAQAKGFFEEHVQKQSVGGLSISLFEDGFESLFDSTGEARREILAKAFLPFLRQKFTRQFVVETLSSTLNTDPALTETLLTDTRLLTDPAKPDSPLIEAFEAANTGVSVTFFENENGEGKAPGGGPITLTTADTGIKDASGNPIKPVGAKSASFAGCFEVPSTGTYRFFTVISQKGPTAELRLAEKTMLSHKAAKGGDELPDVELEAGTFYRFTFKVHSLNGGDVSLEVEGGELPRGSLSRLTLYPDELVKRVSRAQVLLAKAFQFIEGFGLSEREIHHLLASDNKVNGFALADLPTPELEDGKPPPELEDGKP